MNKKIGKIMMLNQRGRRDLALHLRTQHGWKLERIGRMLGIKGPAVSRLLRRAGTPKDPNPSMPFPRQLVVRPLSLSDGEES
jgi:hypothetical protein